MTREITVSSRYKSDIKRVRNSLNRKQWEKFETSLHEVIGLLTSDQA